MKLEDFDEVKILKDERDKLKGNLSAISKHSFVNYSMELIDDSGWKYYYGSVFTKELGEVLIANILARLKYNQRQLGALGVTIEEAEE